MPRCSLLALIAVVVLAAPAAAHADAGDIIVQRETGLDSQERRELRKDAGVELVAALPLERTELVEPAPGETAAAALAALRADSDVVYAELDQPVHLLGEPNDFYWPSLWGLENSGQTYAGQAGYVDADIDALAAWEQSQGAGVTVAVVDTGINADHVDLAGQLTGNAAEVDGTPGVDDDGNGYVDDTRGWDFVTGDNLPQDGHGHGTHVSGTIAAAGDNTVGVIGVAPGAKVLPLRALGDNGVGLPERDRQGVRLRRRPRHPDRQRLIRRRLLARDRVHPRERGRRAPRHAVRRRRRQRPRRQRRAGARQLPVRAAPRERDLRRRERQPRPARVLLQLRRHHR